MNGNMTGETLNGTVWSKQNLDGSVSRGTVGLRKGSGADSTQKPGSSAVGSKTTALGDGCVAGAMGYYYSGVDFDNKYIFLSDASVYPSKKVSVTEITECELYRDDLTLGYEVGDRIYTNFGLCGTIEEIQGNCIKYQEDTAYPYAYSEWTWPVIYAPDKPTVGAVSHSAAAFASGKKTQALAAYSAALGRLSRVLAEGGFTSGDGTVVITPYGAVFGKYNEITDDIFVIGNGKSDTDRRNALSVSWGGLLKTHDGVETEGDVVARSGGTYQAKMTGSADSVVFGMVNQDGSVPNMLRLTADKSSLSKPLGLGSGGLGTSSADEVRSYLTELLNLANAVFKNANGSISEDLRVKSLATFNGEVSATTGTDAPARMYVYGGSAYVALGAGLNYIRLSPDYTTLGKPLTVSSGGTGVKSEEELKEKVLELAKDAYVAQDENGNVKVSGKIESTMGVSLVKKVVTQAETQYDGQNYHLYANHLHVFGEMSSLRVHPSDVGKYGDGYADEYHFRFTSGATPTALTLWESVIGKIDVKAATVYDVRIVDGFLTYHAWSKAEDGTYSVSENQVNKDETVAAIIAALPIYEGEVTTV